LTETFSCPRRFGLSANSELCAYPMDDHWGEDNTCSHCGSLNPVKALELIETGTKVTPTDKKYKIYLEYGKHNMQKFYFPHFNQEQLQQFAKLYLEQKIRMNGDFYSGLPFKFEMK
jgi:hypothetical protein